MERHAWIGCVGSPESAWLNKPNMRFQALEGLHRAFKRDGVVHLDLDRVLLACHNTHDVF